MPADPHPPTEAPELTWDHELSRWVPAYRQTRWDPTAAEAAASTSLDQPGTGAGYTAVEPAVSAERSVLGVPWIEEVRSALISADAHPQWDRAEYVAGQLVNFVCKRETAAEKRGWEQARLQWEMATEAARAASPAQPTEMPASAWLLDLVHAAETAADETGCNDDHEGNEGCDGCAWAGLIEAVPVRLRNAADERASKGGAW